MMTILLVCHFSMDLSNVSVLKKGEVKPNETEVIGKTDEEGENSETVDESAGKGVLEENSCAGKFWVIITRSEKQTRYDMTRNRKQGRDFFLQCLGPAEMKNLQPESGRITQQK